MTACKVCLMTACEVCLMTACEVCFLVVHICYDAMMFVDMLWRLELVTISSQSTRSSYVTTVDYKLILQPLSRTAWVNGTMTISCSEFSCGPLEVLLTPPPRAYPVLKAGYKNSTGTLKVSRYTLTPKILCWMLSLSQLPQPICAWDPHQSVVLIQLAYD